MSGSVASNSASSFWRSASSPSRCESGPVAGAANSWGRSDKVADNNFAALTSTSRCPSRRYRSISCTKLKPTNGTNSSSKPTAASLARRLEKTVGSFIASRRYGAARQRYPIP